MKRGAMEEEEAAAVEVVRWRPWSDLLEDILRLIFAKLYFADQTRFRAVCKGWSSPVYGGRSKEKLPWLVIRYPPTISEYTFFVEKELCDLYNQKTYVIRDNNLNDLCNARLLASRYGWLLLGKEKSDDDLSLSLFIVYNPFTRQVINLPLLDHKFHNCNATFSSAPPTSPDCLVFVCCYFSDGTFDISMFEYGRGRNEKWTTLYFSWEPHYLGNAESMVYINGVLYCAFYRGGSGVFAFDVENKQGQWLGKGYSSLSHRHYLVEANDELLLATWSSYDKWCIFKFDSSGDKTTWIPQIKLENQALFAGYTSLMVPAVGDTSFLANKIYYHDNCNRKFRVYCLLSGKSCENDKIYNCIRMPSIGSRSTWIEPPW